MTLFSILALVKTPIWSCPTADGMRYRLLGRVALAWFFCSSPLAVRQSSTHSKGPWSGQSPYIHCLWHSSQTERKVKREWQVTCNAREKVIYQEKVYRFATGSLQYHNVIECHMSPTGRYSLIWTIYVHYMQPPKVFEWFWSEKGFFLSGFPLGVLFTKNYFFHINIGTV